MTGSRFSEYRCFPGLVELKLRLAEAGRAAPNYGSLVTQAEQVSQRADGFACYRGLMTGAEKGSIAFLLPLEEGERAIILLRGEVREEEIELASERIFIAIDTPRFRPNLLQVAPGEILLMW